jgi:hypothetical protein
MSFLKFDLGSLNSNETIEVILFGNAANVRLLNSTNMSNYEHGRNYRCFGGLAKRSPIRLTVPNYDHWFIVVDMIGLRGKAEASVRILS